MKTSIFKFCEGMETFSRKQLEEFIMNHSECARVADSVGVKQTDFSMGISREFVARSMTCGYLDGVRCTYWVKDKRKKPYLMSLHATKGDSYFHDMVNLESLSDEDIFGEPLIRGSVGDTEKIIMLKRSVSAK